MDYQFRFDVVWSNFEFLLQGIKFTVYISVATMVLGTLIGIVTAILRLTKIKAISIPITAYVEFFRGTPSLIQIVWIYYCLPIVTGINIPGVASVVLAMALNSGAYLSEVFRAGIQGIDKGHIEAAYALGLRRKQAMTRIILPQAAYRMIPAVGNVYVSDLKMSSLASIVGIEELMRQGQSLIQYSFRPLEVFTVVALLYFCLTYLASMILKFLEWRFAYVKERSLRQQFRLMFMRLSPEKR
jgi:polar amino acid transport system permease protein